MPKSTAPNPLPPCGCHRCLCHRGLRCRCHDYNALLALALVDFGWTRRRHRSAG